MNNGLAVLSPLWSEHFKNEVGFHQPPFSSDFQSPLDLYFYSRELFSTGADFPHDHPWVRNHPLLQALSALAGKHVGPFIPLLEKPLPIALSCQLALLWAILGYEEVASQLASSLFPLVMQPFTSFWSEERVYDVGESEISFALLLRSLGRATDADIFYKNTLPKDRFFSWLYERNVAIQMLPVDCHEYTLSVGNHVTIGLSLLHHRGQAGAMRSGSIEIPAFGPHLAPLSNSNLFGIADVMTKDGWFCSDAAKEAWFKVELEKKDAISLQVIGVDPEKPSFFVFYVKSTECAIEERIFKPKSLQRFSGNASVIGFRHEHSYLEIHADTSLPVELIPLSGGDNFWGASFLLSFKLPSVMGKVAFTFFDGGLKN